MKICKWCGEGFEKGTGLLCAACYKIKRKEYDQRWKEKDPERFREWYTRHNKKRYDENPEYHRERARNWYRNNTERAREKNRKWAQENRARRALTYKLWRQNVNYTEEALEYARLILGDPCSYCGEDATSIDHIIPVSKGGTSYPDNLAPACGRCNSTKRDRDLLGFLVSQRR